MNSMFLLALIQIINFCRVMADIDSDQKRLDKFIDQIEDNEYHIHRGIANGKFDQDDPNDREDDREDENYGKLLLQGMSAFRKMKIPGVDYEMEPVPVPIEVSNEVPVDHDDDPDIPPPPPEADSNGPRREREETEATPQPLDSPQSPQSLEETPRDRYPKPNSIQDSLRQLPRDNVDNGMPRNDPIPELFDLKQDINKEIESPLPINTYHETLDYKENVPVNDENNKLIEFGGKPNEPLMKPLPPMSHSSYQDSANFDNVFKNNKKSKQKTLKIQKKSKSYKKPKHSKKSRKSRPQSTDRTNEDIDSNINKEQYHDYNEQNAPKKYFEHDHNNAPIDSPKHYRSEYDYRKHIEKSPNSEPNHSSGDQNQNIDHMSQPEYNPSREPQPDYNQNVEPNSNPQSADALNPDQPNTEYYINNIPNHGSQPESHQNNDQNYRELQPEYQTNTEPNGEPQPEYPPSSEPNSEPYPGYPSNSGSNGEPHPEYPPSSELNREPHPRYPSNSESNGEPHQEYQPNSEPNRELHPEYPINSGSNGEPHPEYQPNSEPNIEIQPNSDLTKELQPEYLPIEPNRYPQPISEPNSEVQSEYQTNPEPNSEPQSVYQGNAGPNTGDQQNPGANKGRTEEDNKKLIEQQKELDYYLNRDSTQSSPDSENHQKNGNNDQNHESAPEPEPEPEPEPVYYPNTEPNDRPEPEHSSDMKPKDYYKDLQIMPNPDPNAASYDINDTNQDPEHPPEQDKQDANDKQDDLHPTQPEVGSQGDNLLKYYEDQSKVDSLSLTALAGLAPEVQKRIRKKQIERNENLNKFENYKNTNDAQVFDENKNINKRIGLTSDQNREQQKRYNPKHTEQRPDRYYSNPTSGSRVYSKSQEYHSYTPNDPSQPNEELPTDEPNPFYDKWAEEHIRLAQEMKESEKEEERRDALRKQGSNDPRSQARAQNYRDEASKGNGRKRQQEDNEQQSQQYRQRHRPQSYSSTQDERPQQQQQERRQYDERPQQQQQQERRQYDERQHKERSQPKERSHYDERLQPEERTHYEERLQPEERPHYEERLQPEERPHYDDRAQPEEKRHYDDRLQPEEKPHYEERLEPEEKSRYGERTQHKDRPDYDDSPHHDERQKYDERQQSEEMAKNEPKYEANESPNSERYGDIESNQEALNDQNSDPNPSPSHEVDHQNNYNNNPKTSHKSESQTENYRKDEPNNENSYSNGGQVNQKSNHNIQYDFPQKKSKIVYRRPKNGQPFGTVLPLPFSFESLIESDPTFLDDLMPHNGTATLADYQDYRQYYANNNGQEVTRPEIPLPIAKDETQPHQSSTPASNNAYAQHDYKYEPRRQGHKYEPKPQRATQEYQSRRQQSPQQIYHSHGSQTYTGDQSESDRYNDNNDYMQSNGNSNQDSDPRQPKTDLKQNDQSMANQRQNEYNNYRPNDRNANQQQYSQPEQSQQYDPRVYQSRRGSKQYYGDRDQQTAGTHVDSADKLDPKTGSLVSEESRNILTKTNSTINPNISNKTIAIKSVDSFRSWIKPLTLKTKLLVIEDKNDTKIQKNINESTKANEGLNENRKKGLRVQSIKRNDRKSSSKVTRKPRVKQEVSGGRVIHSQNLSNHSRTYDMIKDLNNSSEFHLKLADHKPQNPMLRTVRSRPQRSISDKSINSSDNSNFTQILRNSQKSRQNIYSSLRNILKLNSGQSQTSEPKCAKHSSIKNFCYESDDEYPHESMRKILMKNAETFRSVYRRLNSSLTNDHNYDEDSANSLANSCKAHTLTIRPLRARNIDGEWKVIANLLNLFEQKITLTKCSEEQKDCETNTRKDGSKCVVKYSLNNMITYNREKNGFEIDMFRIPNACSCSVTKTNII